MTLFGEHLCHDACSSRGTHFLDSPLSRFHRLALGYNLITSLPSNFADLSRLRYLNVRYNLMSTFPSVLCTLPCLEILDISRNKIRKLPSEPGRLLELRVLSISNNRLRKLPVWFNQLKYLRILKLEGNPVNWPPPHVSVMPPYDKGTVVDENGTRMQSEDNVDKEAAQVTRKKAEDRHMALWIANLKGWVEENKERSKTEQESVKVQENSTGSALKDDLNTGQTVVEEVGPLDEADAKASEPGQGAETPGESKRSIGATFLSIESEVASDDDQDKSDEVLTLPVVVLGEQHRQLLTESPRDMSRAASKDSAAVETNLDGLVAPPLPDDPEERSMSTSRTVQQGTLDEKVLDEVTPGRELPISSLQQHGRNSSLSMAQPNSSLVGAAAAGLRRGLRNKKSLPDLRQSHGAIMMERRETTDVGSLVADDTSPTSTHRQRRPSGNIARRPPLPQSSSDNPATRADALRTVVQSDAIDVSQRRPSNATEVSDAAASSSAGNKSANSAGLAEAQPMEATSGAVEVERNSYFRRLSTLPASTISQSISGPVLQCIDATRGILYALSQMHTALKQYITLTSDERTTSQLSRALDIASGSMASLINSLDRFDSLSRIKGGTLDPIVVRSVLVSCSESVGTFGKVVSVLQLQLKSLQAGSDIRFTRTLLLLLYGSLAEVGNSWTVMEPLFKEVAPYLQGHEAGTTVTGGLPGSSNTYTLPSIAEASSPISSNTARFQAASSRPQRRRHAGSFSAQDVAQGAFMSPSIPVPLPPLGHEDGRKGQRPAALGPFAPPTRSVSYQIQQGDVGGGNLVETSHDAGPQTPKERARQATDDSGTAASRRTLSTASGPTTRPQPNMAGAGYGVERGKAVVDDHLVLLLVRITSIAYSVWASIHDHLSSLGISIEGSKGSALPGNFLVTPESTPVLKDDGFAVSPKTPPAKSARPPESSSSSTTVVQEQNEDVMSPASSTARYPHRDLPSKSALTKLRQLSDLTHRLIEQTNKLEACCEKVQERSGPRSPVMNANSPSFNENFQQLFAESSSFIKSILHVSHFLKSLSQEHQLPKAIKANLAQLTTCARDLTLHLHFLGGPASHPSSLVSPQQQRQIEG